MSLSVTLILALLGSGCSTMPAELTNPVTWYGVNGLGDSVSFDVFDLVCERYLRDQRIRARREVEVTSCGNDNGVAAIRYRREGLAPGSPWTTQNGIAQGARILMR